MNQRCLLVTRHVPPITNLSVEDVSQCWNSEQAVESLIATYMSQKMSKEVPPSGNSSSLQAAVDESKTLEWDTLIEKGAIKVHYGKHAQYLREKFSHRFMGSRFVIVRKPIIEGCNVDEDDPNTYKIKSRWCLQGHLDPDLDQKMQDGLLQSPTLSQSSRVLIMQVLASYGWDLQLGDIKGAFLEAGPLDSKYRPCMLVNQMVEYQMCHPMQYSKLLEMSMDRMMPQVHGFVLLTWKHRKLVG